MEYLLCIYHCNLSSSGHKLRHFLKKSNLLRIKKNHNYLMKLVEEDMASRLRTTIATPQIIEIRNTCNPPKINAIVVQCVI